jgi:predicted TIM-barrel fold metal-dependent hydrolase
MKISGSEYLRLAIVFVSASIAQAEPPLDGREGRPLALENFRPKSQLVLPRSEIERAKFPVVDVHVHPKIRFRHAPAELDAFVRTMDEQNIVVCVSLDGGLGDDLQEHKDYLWTKYRDRFVIFANLDWKGTGREDEPATWAVNQPGFGRQMAQALELAREQGVSGLKISKEFGLTYKNADGSLIKIDDPRFDPIWEACGKLGLPVLIHTADPVAFFEPIDETNERWEELRRHLEWSFHGEQFPEHTDLLAALLRVVKRHPETSFIAAHLMNYAENLSAVGTWLDEHPNLYVDTTSRINELGRQPYTAREFFIKHSDRILFGSDGPRPAARLLPQWRFFETRDEYFPYAENPFPPQGLWNIHGIGLPDDVLRKLYHENAAQIIPGVRERLAETANGE